MRQRGSEIGMRTLAKRQRYLVSAGAYDITGKHWSHKSIYTRSASDRAQVQRWCKEHPDPDLLRLHPQQIRKLASLDY